MAQASRVGDSSGAATQPSGTVTLVFTDIAGSTRLLDGLGAEGYREAPTEHQRIVRAAFGDLVGEVAPEAATLKLALDQSTSIASPNE